MGRLLDEPGRFGGGRDEDPQAGSESQGVVDPVVDREAPPERRVAVLPVRDRMEAVAVTHNVAPATIECAGRGVLALGLGGNLLHRDLGGGAERCPVRLEEGVLRGNRLEVAAESRECWIGAPLEHHDRRRRLLLVDRHLCRLGPVEQGLDPARDVALRLEVVEEHLHRHGLRLRAVELRLRRRLGGGSRRARPLRRLADGVLGGVEHETEFRLRDFAVDDSKTRLFELAARRRDGLSDHQAPPMKPLWASSSVSMATWFPATSSAGPVHFAGKMPARFQVASTSPAGSRTEISAVSRVASPWTLAIHSATRVDCLSIGRVSLRLAYFARPGSRWMKPFCPPSLYSRTSYSIPRPSHFVQSPSEPKRSTRTEKRSPSAVSGIGRIPSAQVGQHAGPLAVGEELARQ